MIKVLFASNNYYLYDEIDFYGPFHSLADAEWASKLLNNQRKVDLKTASDLLNYKYIKSV